MSNDKEQSPLTDPAVLVSSLKVGALSGKWRLGFFVLPLYP